MHRPGHFGVSLTAAALVMLFLPNSMGAVLAMTIVAAEPIPDYDLRTELLDHRGFSHTVFFAVGVAVVVGSGTALAVERLNQVLGWSPITVFSIIAAGTYIGIMLHIATDILTVGEGYFGVQPLWPVYPEYELNIQWRRADDTFANLLLFSIGATTATAVVYYQFLTTTI